MVIVGIYKRVGTKQSRLKQHACYTAITFKYRKRIIWRIYYNRNEISAQNYNSVV